MTKTSIVDAATGIIYDGPFRSLWGLTTGLSHRRRGSGEAEGDDSSPKFGPAPSQFCRILQFRKFFELVETFALVDDYLI